MRGCARSVGVEWNVHSNSGFSASSFTVRIFRPLRRAARVTSLRATARKRLNGPNARGLSQYEYRTPYDRPCTGVPRSTARRPKHVSPVERCRGRQQPVVTRDDVSGIHSIAFTLHRQILSFSRLSQSTYQDPQPLLSACLGPSPSPNSTFLATFQ